MWIDDVLVEQEEGLKSQAEDGQDEKIDNLLDFSQRLIIASSQHDCRAGLLRTTLETKDRFPPPSWYQRMFVRLHPKDLTAT